jgi:hypothetical protein
MNANRRSLSQQVSDWLRQQDRRVLGGAAAGLVIVVAVAIFALTRGPAATPSPTPTVAPTATAVGTATARVARATPPGTPAPRPTAPVGLAASIPVPSAVPKAPRPTPSPEPGLWRIEGYVVDESGKPIENVCVVVGPVGCQTHSPHTDERGNYFVDIALSTTTPVTFDFYFEIPGRESKWLRITPTSSTVFNLVLRRTG